MNRDELIKKTAEYVSNLEKIAPTTEEIVLCKSLHSRRMENMEKWNSRNVAKTTSHKISKNHSEGDLWWGLLGELVIAKKYGGDGVVKEWENDQERQNLKVLMSGVYDCKDIGHTQVRAAEWDERAPRRLIYRPNDFRTKSTQPVIACVVNTVRGEEWVAVCGYMGWEELKERRMEFWCDPDRSGFTAMFVPYWELRDMSTFDIKLLR